MRGRDAAAAGDRGAPPRSGWTVARVFGGCLLLVGGGGTLCAFATPPPISILGGIAAFSAALLAVTWGLVWLWRLFTWRVRRRLFASFVAIGVAPLVLAIALTVVVELFYWVFSTASIVSIALDDVGAEVGFLADILAARVEERRAPSGAVDVVAELGSMPRFPGVVAHVLDEGDARDPFRPDREAPAWMREESDGSYVRTAGDAERQELCWASVRRLPDGRRLVAVLPFDPAVSMALGARTGIQIAALTVFVPDDADPTSINVDVGAKESDAWVDSRSIHIEMSDEDEAELARAYEALPPGAYYPWLLAYPVVRWEDESPGTGLLLFFSTFASDLARLQRTYGGISGKLIGVMATGFVSLFAIAYLLLLFLGVLIAASVSGGVGRLYQATQEFARGNLDYRVRVLRRDQMGELARSMNEMAASVQRLLRESAERERLSEEFRLAQDIQQRLLPAPLSPLRGAQVAGSLRPMSEVGGDTYDWRALSDHELLVMVADVSGHGLRPGLLAAMAKACLLTKVAHTSAHSEVLAALHRLTRETADPRLFMTVALATFDLEAGSLDLSSAGHPPCLRLRGAEVAELGDESYPLGVREERRFSPRRLDQAPGDVYLFVSDGLVEGRNAQGEAWGYERLAASLRRSTGREASAIVEAILADFAVHAGGAPQDDDVTLVVVTIPGKRAGDPSGEGPPAA